MRREEYKQQLEEMKRRVQTRPLLFEKVAQVMKVNTWYYFKNVKKCFSIYNFSIWVSGTFLQGHSTTSSGIPNDCGILGLEIDSGTGRITEPSC